MAKADRLEALDLRRAELETEYEDALLAALRSTAAGSWGLFDHNQDRQMRARIAQIVENLAALAETIDTMREKLGLEQFALHQEFLKSRGKPSAHAVGEPKQARAWLDRLESSDPEATADRA